MHTTERAATPRRAGRQRRERPTPPLRPGRPLLRARPRHSPRSIRNTVAGAAILLSLTLPQLVRGADFDLLVIGDSITLGTGFQPGFRDDLHALLAAEPEHTFTFVGSTGTPPLQGHFLGGKEIEDFYPPGFGNGWGNGKFDTTPDLGPPGTPHIAAIHLGTNDVNNQPPPYAPYSLDHGRTLNPGQSGQLAEYLLYLVQWQDGTFSTNLQHIILSLIIPICGQAQDTADFNNALIAMSEDFGEGVLTGSPVRITLADHYNHFLSNADLCTFGAGDWMADDLHPNDAGYTEMANIYHPAILAAIDDVTPPAAVSDLAAAGVDSNRVTLAFTASGDDGGSGRAARYDIRFSTAPIDAGSFALDRQVIGEPAPDDAGTAETIEVTGLLPGTTYYLALKVVDDGGNRSTISNPIEITTTGTPTTILTLRDGLDGYFGTEDNSMIDGRETDNYGSGIRFSVGKHGTDEPVIVDIKRSLIRFDLAQIPPSATILDARLELFNDIAESAGPVEVGAYRVTKRWIEGSRTTPLPENGSSCWSAAQLGILPWSAPGCDAASDAAQNDDLFFDRFATPEDTATLTASNATYEWDLTAAVGRWVSGEWNNDGVLLRALVESSNSRRSFYSSESTFNQSLRPTLVVRLTTEPNIGVAEGLAGPPVAARLRAAYPNPFAGTTTIRYELEAPGRVRLRVYDVRGRLVRELVDRWLGAGDHRAAWRGDLDGGARAAAGVYLYRLEAPGARLVRKVVLTP